MRFPTSRCLLLGALVTLAACKDQGPDEVGPPTDIVVVAGANQSALANTAIPSPIQISVRDANGQGVAGQTVAFSVIAGGGFLASMTATTDANGAATVPAWTLGKSAVIQTVRATLSSITEDINVSVLTAYQINVRFYGEPMTPQQQAFFTNAAARISGIITGDVIDADTRNLNLNASVCGVEGQPNLNEIIDDVLIYAAITSIDGAGKILAQAGPCFVRQAPSSLTAVGVMEFDKDDLGTLGGSGSLQDVVTHEMLHVMGIGTLWDFDRSLLTDTGTANPRYVGSSGVQGCQQVGGSVACASTVPVENEGGAGTADSHWRESTFNTEMMTGFLDAGANPISALTMGALADLGYIVNPAASDDYTIFNNMALRSLLAGGKREGWENVRRPVGVLVDGGVTPVRSK